MRKPESQFPTIADLQGVLADLVEQGLGALPVQVLVVPDSTMQALSRHLVRGDFGLAPAMMELTPDDSAGRIPVTLVSAERLASGWATRIAVQ